MKQAVRRSLVVLALSVSASSLSSLSAAEIELPAPSPPASVSQTIGVTRITIDYHRPGVKGRKIWGELVTYDKVWRLGANEATTISFTDPVKIKGRVLPAGTYALFAIPKPAVFTVVFNTVAKQWGAFRYDESKDVLRFDLQPEKASSTEWMTFDMVPAAKGVVRVDWRWERLRFSFDVEVDVDKVVWSRIDAVLAKDAPAWDDYLSAAQHAWTEKTRLDDAMTWVDKSIALKEHFWNDELKARLLASQGKYAEAIPLAEKAKELAKEKAPKEYFDGLDKALAEWRAKARS
jgi:hypothetical protein